VQPFPGIDNPYGIQVVSRSELGGRPLLIWASKAGKEEIHSPYHEHMDLGNHWSLAIFYGFTPSESGAKCHQNAALKF
jgi:hypothetical protein